MHPYVSICTCTCISYTETVNAVLIATHIHTQCHKEGTLFCSLNLSQNVILSYPSFSAPPLGAPVPNDGELLSSICKPVYPLLQCTCTLRTSVHMYTCIYMGLMLMLLAASYERSPLRGWEREVHPLAAASCQSATAPSLLHIVPSLLVPSAHLPYTYM